MSGTNNIKLTPRDRQILESYKPVLDGLAEYLGSGYELVLHTLDNLEHSVIKIVNGEHTGRTEGAPITDLALNMLEKIKADRVSNHICYFTTNSKGEPLKSTTIIIRGVNNTPIGLLCINLYLSTPFNDIIGTFSLGEQVKETFTAQTNVIDNPRDYIRASCEKAKRSVENNPSVLPSVRNREVIAHLDEKGIFQMKDSVAIVAESLSISKNTVYLHLRTTRNTD